MTTPERLPQETEKAYNAFKLYCEVGGSAQAVYTKLACSRRNVTRWQAKHNWIERFKAHRQAEVAAKNAAEERAIERTAQITEERKAALAQSVYSLSEKFIDHAHKIYDTRPIVAERL